MFVLERKQVWEDVIGETAIKLRTKYLAPRSGYTWSTATPFVVYIQKSHHLLRPVGFFPLVVVPTILSQCLNSVTFKPSMFLPAKKVL